MRASWKFRPRHGWIEDEKRECVAFVASGQLDRIAKGELLAAAPDMFDALEQARAEMFAAGFATSRFPSRVVAFGAVDLALRKAKGE